ncbi:MAG TPA: GAF domain-containing protein [Acidobacteriaceae bacterium]|nr:GAF domain-containing protein [Acidobacteriaceae bacterium]
MTMYSPSDAILELSSLLLAASDSVTRSGLIASAVVEIFAESACVVHRYRDQDEEAAWTATGVAGDVSVEQDALPSDYRLLVPLLSGAPQVLFYPSTELRREDFAHLHVTRSVESLAYLPLVEDEHLIGAIEVVSFSPDLQRKDLKKLIPILHLAPTAIVTGESFESQRQNLLDSVHRMTQLYDLEKSLNATLELDAVIAMIPMKVAGMLSCQALHLWLFDGSLLRLMSSSGEDATVSLRMTQAVGEGYVADMAEEGEPLLIADPEDERLMSRNAGLSEDEQAIPITTALLVPLLQDGAEVGVLEAVNKDGPPFDEDDEFFLTTIAETVSSALKNASLLLAERKLEILEALVHVSSEITSTLRLDRLLQIIVNSPQNVLPFELCAIALDNRGRLQLKAISGMSSLPLGDTHVEQVNELIRWLSSQSEPLHLRQPDESASPDIPAEIARHFEASGYRALYSLPLMDDQGRVGLLLYESSDPDFLDLPHTEMIKILAGQATVAIRNALLYREVPLISLLEPLMHKKQAMLRSSRSRRIGYAAAVVFAVLFLVLCPLPMRVGGTAVVTAQHQVTVAAPANGNITAVYVHEGDRVAAGQVLGVMNDWQWRTDLAASDARYKEEMLVMQADLARGVPQAGADRAQVEYLRSEAARARARLESAQLRSPITGIVVTPAVQNAAGEHLDAGAPFAQVLDLSSAVVDVAVPQRDVALVRPGMSAAIKLDSYPQRSWHHSVAVVGSEAQPGDGDRSFDARIPLPNADAMLRAGMTGSGKIFIGFRPAGYVLLRRPALWIWQTLWNWIGW